MVGVSENRKRQKLYPGSKSSLIRGSPRALGRTLSARLSEEVRTEAAQHAEIVTRGVAWHIDLCFLKALPLTCAPRTPQIQSPPWHRCHRRRAQAAS